MDKGDGTRLFFAIMGHWACTVDERVSTEYSPYDRAFFYDVYDVNLVDPRVGVHLRNMSPDADYAFTTAWQMLMRKLGYSVN